jgi:hypothetical protein
MDGIVSVRPRMHFTEKIVWLLFLTALATLEIRVITQSDQENTQDKVWLAGKLKTIQDSFHAARDGKEQLDSVPAGTGSPNVAWGCCNTAPYRYSKLPEEQPTQTGKRFVDEEKLGLALADKETSSATVINDGTNEAGNLANQIVIGLWVGKCVAEGNFIKTGAPSYFPDPLTLEVSSVRTSAEDHSVEEAKALKAALTEQGVVAVLQYTQQAFPPNFMRVKIAGQ